MTPSDRSQTRGRIIAFSGTHGTGKTTAAYRMAARLKRSETGDVGIVCEIARQCPYPIVSRESIRGSPEAQMWIFASQIRAEMDACMLYPVVVCDRTILDCIAYSAACGYHDLAYAMREIGRHHIQAYKSVYLMRISHHDYLADDGVRNLDRPFRQEVEMSLISLYRDFGFKVMEG